MSLSSMFEKECKSERSLSTAAVNGLQDRVINLFVFFHRLKESLIKCGLPDWRRFFVRTRWKTGRRVGLCGGFSAEVRAKKMR